MPNEKRNPTLQPGRRLIMISSRKIEDLHPHVQTRCENFLAECKKSGIDILITCTYRDIAAQNALYAQGRTTLGHVVTDARGGQSFHQYCVAFDTVPIVNGKPIWDNEQTWLSIGHIGKCCGLEWAGDWIHFKEKPHFQFTGGLTLKDFQNGKPLPN